MWSPSIPPRQCERCGAFFYKKYRQPSSTFYKQNFCSATCANIAKRGRTRLRETKFRWSECYKEDPDTGCWVWLKFRDCHGYGKTWHRGRKMSAHRVFYELHKGPIPDGLEIDHLCRNRGCVNPAHLEAVTRQINVQRGLAGQPKQFCIHGHPLDDSYLYFNQGKPRRCCRQCSLNRAAAKREMKKYAMRESLQGETT